MIRKERLLCRVFTALMLLILTLSLHAEDVTQTADEVTVTAAADESEDLMMENGKASSTDALSAIDIAVKKTGMKGLAIVWALVFNSIGTAFLIFGNKRKNIMMMAVSIVLLVFPYIVKEAYTVFMLGTALSGMLYLVRR